MRILLITSAFPAHPGDSRGTFIEVLARALADQGARLTVLAPGTSSSHVQTDWRDFQVIRAPYWIGRWQGLTAGLGGIVPNLRRRPWLVLQVPPLIASLAWYAVRLARGHDLVHAHWLYPAGLAGVFAKRARGVPLIVTSHGGDLNLAERSHLLRFFSRRIALSADACIGVSHAMVASFHKLGIPERLVHFVPLGVRGPDEAVNPDSALSREYGNFPGFRIIYVGSLIPRKSVDTLIRAHAELESRGRSVATLLVGAGPMESALRKLVSSRGLENVYFAGEQQPTWVGGWIRQSDVLVLPSLSEGRGLVVLEAMAHQKPTVVSDIPGPRELVQEGQGLLFPPKNHLSLANTLEKLFVDPALASELGRRGRKYIEDNRLTPRQSARDHIHLYREVLEHGRPAPRKA